ALATIVFFLVMRPLLRRVGLNVGLGGWGVGKKAGLPGGAPGSHYILTPAQGFLPGPLARCLAGWMHSLPRRQFHHLADLIEYQRQAYVYHATLIAGHPYGSPWFSWPFLYRPVAYYYEYQGLGTDLFSGHSLVAGIVNLGNPIIWWASIPAVLSL